MTPSDRVDSKNKFFLERFGEGTLTVVNALEEGIPPFGGDHALKTTVFNDEQAYLDWCASFHNGTPCTPHGFEVKARVDPAVPAGGYSVRDGDEIWLGFAMYLPEDFVFEPQISWVTTGIMELQYRTDMPPNTSTKGGPFALGLANGTLKADLKYSPTFHPKDSTETHEMTYKLETGVWYAIVCHVKFSLVGDGFAEIWINGQKTMNKHNISIGYDGMTQEVGGVNYIGAMGLDVMTQYKHIWFVDPATASKVSGIPASVDRLRIYYDSLRVAEVNSGSFEEVDPAQDLGIDYGQFASEVFGDAVANLEAEDDFDADGIINFLEYLFGTDPTEKRVESLLGVEVVDGTIVLEWLQRKRVTEAAPQLQALSDRSRDWTNLSESDYTLSVVPAGDDELEKVQCVFSESLSSAVLFRLAADLPL